MSSLKQQNMGETMKGDIILPQSSNMLSSASHKYEIEQNEYSPLKIANYDQSAKRPKELLNLDLS